MARVLVIDVIDKKDVHTAECKELDDFYRELKCDCFDIVEKKIGSKFFDIFVDDNGLFVEKPVPSMFSSTMNTMLVGNLVFASHDDYGNTTSLSDENIEMIKENVFMLWDEGRQYPAVICSPELD